MPTNSYDLVVLGDELPGLVCAALCARRGLRTLVVADERRPARYPLGGLKLPTGLGILPGRGAGAAARIIRELGLDHALKRRVPDLRVLAQLVGPDARIDLVAEPPVQAKELVRELPVATDALLAAWDQAPEIARLGDAFLAGDDAFPGVGFFERRDAGKQATRATEAAAAWWQGLAAVPALGRALTALAAAAGGPTIDPPPLAIARALELWRAGAPGLRGDGTGLRELLIEKLTGAGGELRAGVVTELVSGWTKLTGVRLESGEEIGAGQVVAAAPVDELIGLFGKKPPKRLVELAAAAQPAGWLYAINLVVDAAAVPEGMAPTVLVVGDPEQPLAGPNAIALHVADADDQGRVVVTVTAVLHANGAARPEPASLAPFRAEVLARLEEVMPFAHQHLIVMHSPYDGVAPVVPGGRGGYDPPRGGPALLPAVWRPTLDGGAGLAAVPYVTGVKNLTLASTQVLPALGQDGALAVGWNAARIACGIGGKKRDYLRDEVVSA
ncbi:MAG: hypothetical protein R3B06_18150 [Kofleriaceae bacterium]